MSGLKPRRAAATTTSNRLSGTPRSGQAVLETFIVVLVVGVLLFGLLQTAVVFSGREVLHHAAARAARARAVGFNEWMAFKAMRVASIPTSGKMLEPVFAPLQTTAPLGANPTPGEAWDAATTAVPGVSERAALERVRIPAYLDSDNHGRADYVLNYAEWERGSFRESEQASAFRAGTLRYRVEQDFPLTLPLNRFVFPFARQDEDGNGRVAISGEAEAGQHASLYLEP